MYLKRLEIQGFKSFARKTVLEFENGITAVVGPNGSGKSNVADCLRWVLGEQSAKMMRGKKSDDVIFAGSDKKGKFGFAEGFATFDNSDRRIPVDSPEVSIGRRIDRSGESEYLINGAKVRLLDIVDLVLKSNIGTSRYTVIGQGTIDQMILAGPAEIKGLLDEASGVKNYYVKRERTLRRLEQTTQNLLRAQDLLNELEPRLKSLRRQAKRMESRVDLENELKTLKREWYSGKFFGLNAQIESEKSKLTIFEKQRLEKEDELNSIRLAAQAVEASSTQDVEQFKLLKEKLQTTQNDRNKLLEHMSFVRGKMDSLKTSVPLDPQTLQVELHQIEGQLGALEAEVAKLMERETSLESEVKDISSKTHNVSQSLDEIYAHLSKPAEIDWKLVELEFASLEHSYESLLDATNKAQSVSEVTSILDSFKEQWGKFKTVTHQILQSPEANLKNSQQQLQSLSAERDKLTANLSDLKLKLSQANLTREFKQKQKEGLEQKKRQLEIDLKRANSSSNDNFWQELINEEKKLNEQLELVAKEAQGLEDQLKVFLMSESTVKQQLAESEKKIRVAQEAIMAIKDQENKIVVEIAKFETLMETIVHEASYIFTPEEINQLKSQRIAATTPGLEEKIQKLTQNLAQIPALDELTVKEYNETETRYTNLSTQISDLQKGMQDLKQILDELDEHIKSKFNESFHKINEKFEYYFRLLFNGGRAYLSVLKSGEEPTEAEVAVAEDAAPENTLRPEEKVLQKYEKGVNNVTGIDIKATPPGKKLASIQALSGGERALTSIALLCSLLACFPSPFVVLDEVDAALDDANTIRFGQILGTLSHQTQFITITHNRETMAQANTLYGVTMGDDGISKILSVKLEQAKSFAK